MQEEISLFALFRRFLGFGLQAWGGPVAQIDLIRRELVEKDGWISAEKFNRVLAVFQALPGPEAHELCVYFGRVKGGQPGALLAGLGFMLPGVVLMMALAAAYQALGPAVLLPFFVGIKPAVTALIARALHRIGSHALHSMHLLILAIAAFLLTVLQVHFVLVLVFAGVVQLLYSRGWRIAAHALLLGGVLTGLSGIIGHTETTGIAPSAGSLFLQGLQAGLLTFGGAYTAIPFLQQGMVGVYPEITPALFLDAIAFANLIPAPLVSFATFLGFAAEGIGGAIAITLGIFLPSFAFTMLGFRYVEKAIDYAPLHGFLDGVTAGVIGILGFTVLVLFTQTVTSLGLLGIFALALLAFYGLKGGWVVPVTLLAAAALGLALQAI